jgi:TolB protein
VARWIRVALVLTAAFAVGAPAGTPNTSGVVVFASDRDGDYDIYAVNTDGTALTQLTHNDVEDSLPIPSPDGKLIAFFNDAIGLAVIAPDGTGLRPLHGCTISVSWSPDSSRLACKMAGREGISIADPARGTVVSLAAGADDPAWSPDGRTIAFVDSGLWVMPAEGGPRRRLANREIHETPSWSPDSRRIVYAGAAGDARFDLFVTAVDGSGERRLVRDVNLFDFAWSPEGSLIAFTKDFDRGRAVAIYTVRPDGTALRRVSVSTGGESSTAPSWSSDGATLLYERQRFVRGIESDIFVTALGAGAGRALTSPFPGGGTNVEPQWLAGQWLTPVPRPTPRTLALPPGRTLVLPRSAAALRVEPFSADGARAAVGYGRCRALVWEPLARHTTRLPRLCLEEDVAEMALSGTRVAWIVDAFGNTEAYTELDVLRLGTRRSTYVTAESAFTSDGHATYDSGAALHHLQGAGGTIAFTNSRFDEAEARSSWVLLASRSADCPSSQDLKHLRLCRRLAAGEGGVTAAVDAGRVLTVFPGGLVRLLARSGAILREWNLEPGIVNARLQGRTLAVQRGAAISLYDTSTGARTGTRPLVRDEAERPGLLDVQGKLAVYTTGGAIHVLRLTDGRDLALAVPRAAPPLQAELAPSGLFLLWNRMYDRRPVRVSFVPSRALESAVERGG